MKIIDMKDNFIVGDYVVAVYIKNEPNAGYDQSLWVYTTDGLRHVFVFDSKEHTKNCISKLKRFLRSTNSMEDLFPIEEQPGYVRRITRFFG